MLVTKGPQPLEKEMYAFGAGIRPGRALIRRAREHDERARGIGAETLDERARLHDIVLALGHLFDAPVTDRFAVLPGNGADRRAALVELLFHFRRIEPALLAVGVFAVVAVSQQHALREQLFERLAEFDQAQIAHHLGPETRLQKVNPTVLHA